MPATCNLKDECQISEELFTSIFRINVGLLDGGSPLLEMLVKKVKLSM
jgi:hypothetical protein